MKSHLSNAYAFGMGVALAMDAKKVPAFSVTVYDKRGRPEEESDFFKTRGEAERWAKSEAAGRKFKIEQTTLDPNSFEPSNY